MARNSKKEQSSFLLIIFVPFLLFIAYITGSESVKSALRSLGGLAGVGEGLIFPIVFAISFILLILILRGNISDSLNRK